MGERITAKTYSSIHRRLTIENMKIKIHTFHLFYLYAYTKYSSDNETENAAPFTLLERVKSDVYGFFVAN